MSIKFQPDNPAAFVFSHPNHEVAALGMITRLQPSTIVYITDGGGEHRVNETKAVLSQIGLAGSAVFMNRSEDSFYNAILNLDCEYFQVISNFIKQLFGSNHDPSVFCDAVEFYNPVHDMTVPIVKSLGFSSAIFEIPLAYENSNGDVFLQKPPEDADIDPIGITLTKDECELKRDVLQKQYHSLGRQIGRLIEADPTLTKVEWFIRDRLWPIFPADGQAIRYDARGAKLVSESVYDRAITYSGNYVPLISRFLQ